MNSTFSPRIKQFEGTPRGRDETLLDYMTATDEVLIHFAVDHAEDFDANLTVDDLAEPVACGTYVFERWPGGFALVRPENADGERPWTFVWLLFVDPKYRHRRYSDAGSYGQRMMKELIARHCRKYTVNLACYGGKRATFFARCGFRIESRTGDRRDMVLRDDRGSV